MTAPKDLQTFLTFFAKSMANCIYLFLYPYTCVINDLVFGISFNAYSVISTDSLYIRRTIDKIY